MSNNIIPVFIKTKDLLESIEKMDEKVIQMDSKTVKDLGLGPDTPVYIDNPTESMMSMNNNNMDNIQNYGTPKNNVNYSYDSEDEDVYDEVPPVDGGPEMGQLPPVDEGMGEIPPVDEGMGQVDEGMGQVDEGMGEIPPVDEGMGEIPPVDEGMDQGESADLMGPIQPVEIPPGENQNNYNENVTGGRRKTRRMVSFADMFSNTFTRRRRYRKKSRRVNRNKSRKSSNRRRKTRRY
jgi:hypothetical protein